STAATRFRLGSRRSASPSGVNRSESSLRPRSTASPHSAARARRNRRGRSPGATPSPRITAWGSANVAYASNAAARASRPASASLARSHSPATRSAREPGRLGPISSASARIHSQALTPARASGSRTGACPPDASIPAILDACEAPAIAPATPPRRRRLPHQPPCPAGDPTLAPYARRAALGGGPSSSSRRRPTLPGGLPPSTIGAEGLNFSVRNGKRCIPLAMATEDVRDRAAPARRENCTSGQKQNRQDLDPLVPVG